VKLRLDRLVVLALNLKLGLKLFDLQLEACDFGAELGEVDANWPRLCRGWRNGLRMN
jgi:hypothetical protein